MLNNDIFACNSFSKLMIISQYFDPNLTNRKFYKRLMWEGNEVVTLKYIERVWKHPTIDDKKVKHKGNPHDTNSYRSCSKAI